MCLTFIFHKICNIYFTQCFSFHFSFIIWYISSSCLKTLANPKLSWLKMSKSPQLKRHGFAENVAFNRHISSCLSTDNFLKYKIIKSKIFTLFNFITKPCSQGTWFCNKVKTRNDLKFYYFWLYFVNQDFQNGYFWISLLTIIHDIHFYYARSFLRDKTPYRRPYLITCSPTAHSDDGVGKKTLSYLHDNWAARYREWLNVHLFIFKKLVCWKIRSSSYNHFYVHYETKIGANF